MSGLLEAVLRNHTQICDEVYQFLLEENSFIKTTNKYPSDSFIQRKKAYHFRLEYSLVEVKKRQNHSAFGDLTNQRKMEIVQHKMAKIFYLNRENEQLLSRVSLHNSSLPLVHT